MKVRVEFEVEVPFDVTDEALVEEWLRFECGDNGSMSGDNPLVSMPVEPIWGTFEWSEI